MDTFGDIKESENKQSNEKIFVISRSDLEKFIKRFSTLDDCSVDTVMERCFQRKHGARDETKKKCNDQDADYHRDLFSLSLLTFIDINKPPEERRTAKDTISKYLCKPKNQKTSFSRQCEDFLASPEYNAINTQRIPHICSVVSTSKYDDCQSSRNTQHDYKPTFCASLRAVSYLLLLVFILPFYKISQLIMSQLSDVSAIKFLKTLKIIDSKVTHACK